MAEASAKPIHGNVLGVFPASPDGWRRNLAVAETAASRGLRIYPMLVLNPKVVHFSLDSTFIFDEYPTWREILTAPMATRVARLRDPHSRANLVAELGDPAMGSLNLTWDQDGRRRDQRRASSLDAKGARSPTSRSIRANRPSTPCSI
jgi:hypothetical protein